MWYDFVVFLAEVSTEVVVVDLEEQRFGFFGGEEFWLSSELKSESGKEKPCESRACDPHPLSLLWSWAWRQFFLSLRGWASLDLSKAWEQYPPSNSERGDLKRLEEGVWGYESKSDDVGGLEMSEEGNPGGEWQSRRSKCWAGGSCTERKVNWCLIRCVNSYIRQIIF